MVNLPIARRGIAKDVTELIGDTPLVRLNYINENPAPMASLNERINKNLGLPIYLKPERYNLPGSVKAGIDTPSRGDTITGAGRFLIVQNPGMKFIKHLG